MKEAIRQRARELGFDACQFTLATPSESASEFQAWLQAGRHGGMGYLERNSHKRIDPQQILPGARSVICLAASYFSGEGESGSRSGGAGAQPEDGSPVRTLDAGPQAAGVVARYARYADYHDVLGERLRILTGFVDQATGGGTRSLWYVDTGPLLERDLAQRAGVGFIGKHTNLISRQLGNWFVLAEIITLLEIEPDLPEKNRCGHCTRCLAACPTGAITAPFQLDARRCISYLTIELKGSIPVELRPAIGNRIYGCDDCLAVCPWNKFAREGGLLKQHVRPDLQTPDLIELLSLDDAAFKRRFSGSTLLRSKRRGLLRNVCVALGNVGGASDLPVLQRAAGDAEPLIAEHACWAMEQIRARCGLA